MISLSGDCPGGRLVDAKRDWACLVRGGDREMNEYFGSLKGPKQTSLSRPLGSGLSIEIPGAISIQ